MTEIVPNTAGYDGIRSDIVALLESARHAAARSVNALMTASYWEIGRRIVEFEQGGENRAAYGQALLKRLSADLSASFGRGFGVVNLQQMRNFYLAWPVKQIYQTVSDKSSAPRKLQIPSAISADRQNSESLLRNCSTLSSESWAVSGSAIRSTLSSESASAGTGDRTPGNAASWDAKSPGRIAQ